MKRWSETEPSSRIDVSLRRHYVDDFHHRHLAAIPAGSRVIDLGGHRDRKRGDFDIRRYPFEVLCVNVSDDCGADLIADAAALPLQANRYDVVICAELLEHVPSPPAVLSEAYRVLAPGGTLLACTPFLYHIHADPHDFGRYTDYYWHQTLQQAGFIDIVIESQGSFWSVVCDMIRYVVVSESRVARLPIARSITKCLLGQAKRIAVRWDRCHRREDSVYRRFTTGFGISAIKPTGRPNSCEMIAEKEA
jgi:SAM-dependent methyltransferase